MLVGAMYLKIALASDAPGQPLKEEIKDWLSSFTQHKFELNDWGCYSTQSTASELHVQQLAEQVQLDRAHIGILVSEWANQFSITVNKFDGIKSAVCWNEEVSAVAGQSGANIISLPIGNIELTSRCLAAFLKGVGQETLAPGLNSQ